MEPLSTPGLETPGEHAGDLIGRYKLLELIGEGGFGRVWMAEQLEPVKRRVALKIIKLGMDTGEVLTRFEVERQALAMMEHPNIARVFDGGATATGRPYFVMELVKGLPLTAYCKDKDLDTKERLALFIDVCAAVQHAHQKGIIHRDLKPSNILVSPHDGKPVVKVIDFGIAKAIGMELTDKTVFTRLGRMMGTPQYMSPEQAELNALDVDTRSDIYSLGVVLYELLTGATPLDATRLRSAAYAEMQRLIREETPPKPSTRLSESLSHAGPSNPIPHRISPGALRGDLDWIVLKALEKERDRRYGTANALALDIGRHLRDEPVDAGPPGAGYQFRKFAKRNRTALRVAAVIALLLVAGTAVSTWQAMRATEAGNQARAEAQRAVKAEREAAATAASERAAREESEEINRFLTDVFSSPDPSRDGRTIMVAELLKNAANTLETRFADQPERRARLQSTLGRTYHALGLNDEAIGLIEKVRGFYVDTYGPEHPDTLKAMANLAISCFAVGRLNEALKMQEEVLKLRHKIHGPEHPDMVRAMDNLANSYHAAGRLDEALKMHEEVLELSRKVNGAEHPDTLDAMKGLAGSYHSVGRLDEALKMGEEVLGLRRKLSGPEHPQTLTAMHNLALSHSAAGHLEEALKMLEEVLALRRRILGPEHPDTLGTMSGLAISYGAVGRLDDAIKMAEEALALRRKISGPEHPETLGVMNNLATFYFETHRLDEALEMREDVLALRRKVNGDEYPDTLIAMANLAASYHAAGRLDEAIKMGREALEVRRRVLRPGHPDTLTAMGNLALFHHAARRPDEAIKMLEEVLALLRKALGPAHPDTFRALRNLAILYRQTGRVQELARMLGEYAELLRQAGNGSETEFQVQLLEQLTGLAADQCKGPIEESAIDRYYAANKESLRKTSVHLHTITLALEAAGDARAAQLKQAEALRERIVGGTPFADAAREVSKDNWATDGGDRGKVERGDYKEPLNSAIFALQPGTPGIHDDGTSLRILKVEDRVEGGIPPLADVRAHIVEILQRQRRDALLQQWQEEARAKVDAREE